MPIVERVASSAKPNNVSKRKLEFFPFCLYSKQAKVCQADLNRFNKETYCVFRKVEPGVKPRRRKKKKKKKIVEFVERLSHVCDT